MDETPKFGRDSQRKPELSEADKARIRAEEEYRAQVRAKPVAPAPTRPVLKPQPPVKQQLKSAGILVLAMVLVPVLLYFYFANTGSSGLTGIANAASGLYRYEVTASCPVDLTYSSSGGTEQIQDVSTPWSKDVSGVSVPQVIAQLKCDGGDVTAKILNGSTVVKEGSSSGSYAIVHVHP